MLLKRVLASLIMVLCSSASFALDLELTQGINSALPIGIDSFGSERAGDELTAVINSDLRLSGQFKIIPVPQGVSGNPQAINLWRGVGADSVIMGHVTPLSLNRYEVNVDLVDAVERGRKLFSRSFQVGSKELRPLAHHISDLVYEKLTGEKGIFSTRIAYVLVQRNPGARTRYSLEVADADGFNPQSLLVSPEPILSPSWSPDGRQIAYVSFEKRKAQIYTVSVETGQRRLVTDFTGINSAPAWSPDGRQLAVVLSKSGSPKIYSVDLSSGNLKQLTFGDAIDTEPRFTADGKALIFTSGRGGSPQVYRLSLGDGSVSRLTYEGNYNARASLTPDQKHLVMLHREDSKFNIGVQEVDSGRINQVTFALLDESPSIAPNGRLILYATRYNDKGVLGIVSLDGRIQLRLPSREGDVQEPAWSPYLG